MSTIVNNNTKIVSRTESARSAIDPILKPCSIFEILQAKKFLLIVSLSEYLIVSLSEYEVLAKLNAKLNFILSLQFEQCGSVRLRFLLPQFTQYLSWFVELVSLFFMLLSVVISNTIPQ